MTLLKKVLLKFKQLNLTEKLFYFYIILLPFMEVHQFPTLGKKIQYSDLLFPILLASVIYLFIKKEIAYIKTSLYIPIGLYLFMHILSSFNSTDMVRTLLEIAGVFYLIAIFFMVVHLVSSRDILFRVLVAWIIALGLVILCGFIGLAEVYIFKKPSSFFMLSYPAPMRYQLMHRIIPRLISTLRSPDMLMSYLVISVGLLIGFWEMVKKKVFRIVLVILFVLSFFMAIFSAARGILAFLICIIIGMVVFKKPFLNLGRYFIGFIAAILLFILTILTVWEPSKVTISDSITGGETNLSIDFHRTNKSYYYKYALWMVKDHPFIGVGSGNFNRCLAAYYYKDPKRDPNFKDFITYDPHSTYLGLAAETGLLGLMSFLSIIILFLKYMFHIFKNSNDKYLKNLALGIIAAIIGILIQGITMDVQNLRHLWFMLGIGISLKKLEKTKLT